MSAVPRRSRYAAAAALTLLLGGGAVALVSTRGTTTATAGSTPSAAPTQVVTTEPSGPSTSAAPTTAALSTAPPTTTPPTTAAPTTSARATPLPSRPTAAQTTAPRTSAASPSARPPAQPVIVPDPIPYPAARLAQMADYSKRHYGTASSALTPSVIVVHYTETDTYRPVWNLFAANTAALGELPGVCAHFVIDQGGTIHQLVPTTVRCRHTIGLNDSAIGIEVVQSSRGHGAGWAEQQILARPAQATALVALIRQLQAQHGIPTSSVIGHAMANADPRFHDLLGWRNDHTDWGAGPIAELRARL